MTNSKQLLLYVAIETCTIQKINYIVEFDTKHFLDFLKKKKLESYTYKLQYTYKLYKCTVYSIWKTKYYEYKTKYDMRANFEEKMIYCNTIAQRIYYFK